MALSGTNLGSIGYHYGSTEALMTAAMLSAMGDWGDAVTAAGGIEQGRRGVAALLTGRPEDQIDEPTVRTLGSVQMAS